MFLNVFGPISVIQKEEDNSFFGTSIIYTLTKTKKKSVHEKHTNLLVYLKSCRSVKLATHLSLLPM
jgi:hypothetical protein